MHWRFIVEIQHAVYEWESRGCQFFHEKGGKLYNLVAIKLNQPPFLRSGCWSSVVAEESGAVCGQRASLLAAVLSGSSKQTLSPFLCTDRRL